MSATAGSRVRKGNVSSKSKCSASPNSSRATAGVIPTVVAPASVPQQPASTPQRTVSPLVTATAPAALRLGSANAGDHYPIFDFLVGVFRAPSSSEFQAQLEEPFYEPTDRLIVKHGTRIVAHLRMFQREIRFGPLVLPMTGVAELATLSPYRHRGLASALLSAAEDRMRDEGAVAGFVRTTVPELFARRGWIVWGRHCYSVARTRDILAQWNVMEQDRQSRENAVRSESKSLPLSTRIWRHVERGALMRLYAANPVNAYGALVRSDDYWRWLVSRRGYDSIYVVIEGRDKLDLDETPVIGYAVTKAGRIVEMMTDPNRPYAVGQLLTRVCGDAIERDIDIVRLDAPPNAQLHQVFKAAGGQFRNRPTDGGQTLMAKVLDPLDFLRRLEPLLLERVRQCEAPAGELGFVVGEHRFRLVYNRRQVRLDSGRVGRSYVTCGMADLMQLLLGQLDCQVAIREKQLTVSTRTTIDLLTTFFPRIPFWRPPWDELPA
ncbi:MAG: GNAT family N-acetyltransferase [Planctomycetes bacterium]|nr:GNAT family N-acetyltransferase [Planctomycetota bacterium]